MYSYKSVDTSHSLRYNIDMTNLKDIANIRIGYNLGRETKTRLQTVFAISTKDLATNYTEIREMKVPASFNNYLQDGDILVKSRGANYEAKIFHPRGQVYPYIAVNTLIIVRLETEYYIPAYIAHIINSENAQQLLRSLSSGAVLSALSPLALGSLPCPRASLEKQEELEEITRTIDEYYTCLAQYQKAGEKLGKAINQQFMKGIKLCR